LDTGANIHVTNSLHELQNTRKLSNGELKVNIRNGVKVEVEYIGTAKLVLASGHFLDLKGIAFVPSIRRNLISISVLDKCGYNFEIGWNGYHLS
jgi:hypothetical protein